MKVLHLLTMNTFSGAENVACQIIHIMKENYNVDSIYCGLEGPIRQSVEEKGINFIGMKEFTLKEIKRVLAMVKPDIIHAHDMKASFYASLICGNIPLVCHVHNNAFDSRKPNLKSILFFRACKKARKVIWVSESAFEGYAFHKKLKNKSIVLTNIIDINELHHKVSMDQNSYAFDVIFLGRLVREKNPLRLINIFAKVVHNFPNAKLAIVGTGALEQEVKDKVNQLGLSKNVTFFGFQSNPSKILKSSSVMVMTSLWEGLPMSSLEAMALGVPIVSTPTDGLKNLIVNDKTGFLSDDDDILVKDITSIIRDPLLRDRLSNECIKESLIINNTKNYGKKIMDIYKG